MRYNSDAQYHFRRQRQCLVMAASATDETVRAIHQRLALEHYKRAVETDPGLNLFKLVPK